MKNGKGFTTALDQSGGSISKVLKECGVGEDQYSNEDEMFQLVHDMRTHVVTSPSFSPGKILGTILLEQIMDREMGSKYIAGYLVDKGVIPFLKVDKGSAEKQSGAQLIKPTDNLNNLSDRASGRHIFGIKMRSNTSELDEQGTRDIAEQQFEAARQIIVRSLVPIIRPEAGISAKDRAEIEKVLKTELKKSLDSLNTDQLVMLKLTVPTRPDLHRELVEHPNVARVVTLSGGYSREKASELFKDNAELIVGFSRALASDLRVDQSREKSDKALGDAVGSIHSVPVNKN